MRKTYEGEMRTRLQALRKNVEALEQRAEQAETNLELEYFTLLEELRLALENAERKFELLLESHDEQWEGIKTEFEQLWRGARELIRAINSP
ncbi:MAG TPA: hypothetical protein VIW27_04080 [Gammaproteobacteria bacterium]|jgi:hypothetical protein